MSGTAQKKAVQSHRERLAERGIVRFELKARQDDRDLLRGLAHKLAEEGPEADDLRRSMRESIRKRPGRKGGILATFLKSPFAGSDLDLSHPLDPGRAIDL